MRYEYDNMQDDKVPSLIGLLRHADQDIRCIAARMLGCLGQNATAAVPALIDVLQDSAVLVRAMAAWALGAFGQDAATAVPALARLLGQKGAPAETAEWALKRISPGFKEMLT